MRPIRPPLQDPPKVQTPQEPSGWRQVPDQGEALRAFTRVVDKIAARERRPTQDQLGSLDRQAQELRAATLLFGLASQPMPDDWYLALVDLEAAVMRLR